MAQKNKKLKHAPGYRKKRGKGSVPDAKFPRQKIMQEALFHHQAGRLSKAEFLYRQILLSEPDHPEALHFLGMLAHQVGKSETGVELIRRALRNKPDYVDAHVNLGVIFNAQGKMDAAVASFRQALTLKPDYAEALSNLGNALLDQNKLDEAVASFQQALTLKPDHAELHFNLGNALKNQEKLDEAAASFRQALTLKPDYAEAYNNLGSTFKDQGKLDEAVESYQKALIVKPGYTEAHNNLGIVFRQLGRMDDAIVCCRKALSLKPDFAEAYNNLGIIYMESGRNAAAVASFRKALSIKPDYAKAYNNLSLLLKYTQADDVISTMEDLYKKEDISKADRIDLGFTLGKVFEDLRIYEKSFDFIMEANLQKRRLYEYSIHEDFDLFHRIKKIFTADFFGLHKGTGSQDKKPIFIVGMPRSGTTLVEQILASHPLVFGAGELPILKKDLVNSICTEETTEKFPECILNLSSGTFERMGSEYIEKLRVNTKDARNITDKMPDNFLYVGLIKIVLPNAKVINCMRDPMDNCYSIFKKNFRGIHRYAYDMVELGQYYNLYSDLMTHWEKVLPGFIYTLRYEEMVSDQRNQTERLLDYCDLPWDDLCLAFHKTERRVSTASLAQVRQPIYKDSVGLWKRYENQLEPLRKAIYG